MDPTLTGHGAPLAGTVRRGAWGCLTAIVLFGLASCIERDRAIDSSTAPPPEEALHHTAESSSALTARRSVRWPRSLPNPPASERTLPPSARQTHEGYWLGAMIRPQDVATLDQLGIRLVVSAQQPSEPVLVGLAAHGIEQVSVPMSDQFLHGETILEAVDGYDESEIYIHCQYGADRTGVIAAFLLVMRHGWLVGDAFYSVLYATEENAAGLADILANFDLPDYRAWDDPSVGFYSLAAAGGAGGLKTHSSGYVRLISSTLDAIEIIEARRSGRVRRPFEAD